MFLSMQWMRYEGFWSKEMKFYFHLLQRLLVLYIPGYTGSFVPCRERWHPNIQHLQTLNFTEFQHPHILYSTPQTFNIQLPLNFNIRSQFPLTVNFPRQSTSTVRLHRHSVSTFCPHTLKLHIQHPQSASTDIQCPQTFSIHSQLPQTFSIHSQLPQIFDCHWISTSTDIQLPLNFNIQLTSTDIQLLQTFNSPLVGQHGHHKSSLQSYFSEISSLPFSVFALYTVIPSLEFLEVPSFKTSSFTELPGKFLWADHSVRGFLHHSCITAWRSFTTCQHLTWDSSQTKHLWRPL